MKPYIFSWKMPPDVQKKLDKIRGKEARSVFLNRLVRKAKADA